MKGVTGRSDMPSVTLSQLSRKWLLLTWKTIALSDSPQPPLSTPPSLPPPSQQPLLPTPPLKPLESFEYVLRCAGSAGIASPITKFHGRFRPDGSELENGPLQMYVTDVKMIEM